MEMNLKKKYENYEPTKKQDFYNGFYIYITDKKGDTYYGSSSIKRLFRNINDVIDAFVKNIYVINYNKYLSISLVEGNPHLNYVSNVLEIYDFVEERKKKLILKLHNENIKNNMILNWYKNEKPVEFIDDVWYEIKGFMGVSIDTRMLSHPLKSLTSLMERTIAKLSLDELRKLSKHKKKYIDDKSIDIETRKHTLIYLIKKYDF